MDTTLCDVGMVGLGVMGRSLALNLAEHGHSVCGYDKDTEKGQALLTEGAVRLEAVDGTQFNVTDFLGKDQIAAEPEKVKSVFPSALNEKILTLAAAK